jgi:hypothetical protein
MRIRNPATDSDDDNFLEQEGGEEAGDAAEEGEEEVQAGAQGQEKARPLQAGNSKSLEKIVYFVWYG